MREIFYQKRTMVYILTLTMFSRE